jgi:hypothetical protein
VIRKRPNPYCLFIRTDVTRFQYDSINIPCFLKLLPQFDVVQMKGTFTLQHRDGAKDAYGVYKSSSDVK